MSETLFGFFAADTYACCGDADGEGEEGVEGSVGGGRGGLAWGLWEGGRKGWGWGGGGRGMGRRGMGRGGKGGSTWILDSCSGGRGGAW